MHQLVEVNMLTDVHSEAPEMSLAYARWTRDADDKFRCELTVQKDGQLTIVPIRRSQAWNIVKDLMDYLYASR